MDCIIEDCPFKASDYNDLSRHGHDVHRMTLVVLTDTRVVQGESAIPGQTLAYTVHVERDKGYQMEAF